MDTRGRSQKLWQRAFVVIAAIVVGGFMLIFGVWSLLLPRSWCSCCCRRRRRVGALVC